MYELIHVKGNSYYIQSPAKIGLVKVSEDEVVLIDSGNDKDAGRKVRQVLDANGWKLRAIYNTHSNADHIGGNQYLQKQTDCKIYAPGIEADMTNHTILEPAFLYGGFPPKDLRHKFLMAQESDCEYLTDETLPEGFEIIRLPGHFFDMVGFRTPDNVVYLADCLSSAATLEKYGIGFIYDIKAYIETLEMVKEMKADVFVPAHADATSEIRELAQLNIDKVNEIADNIVRILNENKKEGTGESTDSDACNCEAAGGGCADGLAFEVILKKLFEHYNLVMNFEQYVLVGSTVKSYLAYLKDAGRITAEFEDNMLIWKSAEL
ncbi:MAG: MBL fold metallo-hydrolase [Firmicutes bacterium]|nr:MBL fold metallo-hydrolase [Bacillota bacterium]